MVTLATTPPPPNMPVWVILMLGAFAVLGGLIHWQLRTGWHMVSGRGAPPPEMFNVMVRLAFTGLPTCIACSAWCLGMIALQVAIVNENGWAAVTAVGLVALGLVAATWGFKEFLRPSQRRIPLWLRDIPRIDGVWLPR